MFNTNFPQLLRGLVVGQLEADGAFILLLLKVKKQVKFKDQMSEART